MISISDSEQSKETYIFYSSVSLFLILSSVYVNSISTNKSALIFTLVNFVSRVLYKKRFLTKSVHNFFKAQKRLNTPNNNIFLKFEK